MIPDATFTLAGAKAHLRVPHADEDALITAMLDAAVGAVESITRRAWTERKWTTLVDACDVITCGSCAPVFHARLSPATVKAFDTTGAAEVELADVIVSSRYGHSVARIGGWPTVENDAGVIGRLDWTAAPVPADEVPGDVVAAVMLYLGDLYENREAQVIGTIVAQNASAALLVRPYVVDLHV